VRVPPGADGVCALVVREHEELVFISQNGMVQRTSVRGINRYGRASQGVKVMNLREGDQVSALALVVESETSTAAVVPDGDLPLDIPVDGPLEGPLAGADELDVKIAVSEAVGNVVVHAYRDGTPPGSLELEGGIEDGKLVISVTDHGIGMSPHPDSPGLGTENTKAR